MSHHTLSILRAGLLSAALLAFAPAALAEEGEAGHAHDHQHDEHGVSETIVVTGAG